MPIKKRTMRRRSVRKSVRRNVRRNIRKSVGKSVRRNVRKSVRRNVRKSLGKSSKRNVRKSVKGNVRKSVRKGGGSGRVGTPPPPDDGMNEDDLDRWLEEFLKGQMAKKAAADAALKKRMGATVREANTGTWWWWLKSDRCFYVFMCIFYGLWLLFLGEALQFTIAPETECESCSA